MGGSIRPTNPGTLIGTPAFMAPEQVMGRKVTPATDMYAVGGIAYQLLTGHLPYEASTAIEVLTKKMKYEPIRPRQWNPRLDEDVEGWILSLLTREPEHRPRDADAVRRALRRLTESRTLASSPAHVAPAPATRGTRREEWGEAQTILVDKTNGPPQASPYLHKSPWAKTVAMSPTPMPTPGPDLTPPAGNRAAPRPSGASAPLEAPPPANESVVELLPPTVPAGTPSIGTPRLRPVIKESSRVREPPTPQSDLTSVRRSPLALWITLGALISLGLALGVWLLAASSGL